MSKRVGFKLITEKRKKIKASDDRSGALLLAQKARRIREIDLDFDFKTIKQEVVLNESEELEKCEWLEKLEEKVGEFGESEQQISKQADLLRAITKEKER